MSPIYEASRASGQILFNQKIPALASEVVGHVPRRTCSAKNIGKSAINANLRIFFKLVLLPN